MMHAAVSQLRNRSTGGDMKTKSKGWRSNDRLQDVFPWLIGMLAAVGVIAGFGWSGNGFWRVTLGALAVSCFVAAAVELALCGIGDLVIALLGIDRRLDNLVAAGDDRLYVEDRRAREAAEFRVQVAEAMESRQRSKLGDAGYAGYANRRHLWLWHVWARQWVTWTGNLDVSVSCPLELSDTPGQFSAHEAIAFMQEFGQFGLYVVDAERNSLREATDRMHVLSRLRIASREREAAREA